MRFQLSNYRQLKLSSGEEILCEIIQHADEQNAAMIVRAALKILASERADGFRYYALRPWMIYAEDMNELMSINSDQIIGEIIPSDELQKQYDMTVQEYVKNVNKKEKNDRKKATEEASDQLIQKLLNDINRDSDGNVIRLFPGTPRTFH